MRRLSAGGLAASSPKAAGSSLSTSPPISSFRSCIIHGATLGDVREEAAKLACRFGLPGLPIGNPRDLSTLDLARSACIRAFLGEPALLLLESPLQGRFADLMVPLLEALTSARQNGAAAIWLSSSDLVWRDRSIPVKHRLRLREYGLIPARRAA